MKRKCTEQKYIPERENTRKTKRCVWTEEEDKLILKMWEEEAVKDWSRIADGLAELQSSKIGKKTPKQCRERWHNKINPGIKASAWSKEEEEQFFDLFRRYGAKWSELAARLTGRTDNMVKNFYYCKLRKLARRVKKGMIAEDMRGQDSTKHVLLLLGHIREYCDIDASSQSDRYLVGMVRQGMLSTKIVDDYMKKYMREVALHKAGGGIWNELTKSSTMAQASPPLHPSNYEYLTSVEKKSDLTQVFSQQQSAQELNKLPSFPFRPLSHSSASSADESLQQLFLTCIELQLMKASRPNCAARTLPLPTAFVHKSASDSFRPTFKFFNYFTRSGSVVNCNFTNHTSIDTPSLLCANIAPLL